MVKMLHLRSLQGVDQAHIERSERVIEQRLSVQMEKARRAIYVARRFPCGGVWHISWSESMSELKPLSVFLQLVHVRRCVTLSTMIHGTYDFSQNLEALYVSR